MREALEAIIKQIQGIAYSDLSTLEKNILRITARALKQNVKVVDDKIILEEQ